MTYTNISDIPICLHIQKQFVVLEIFCAARSFQEGNGSQQDLEDKVTGTDHA